MVATLLRAVVRQPDIDALARTVIDEFLRVGLTSGSLWTADGEDGRLRRRSHRGLTESALREVETLSVDELYAIAPMLAGGRPLIIEDVDADGIPPALHTGAQRYNAGSFFLSLLITDGRILGLLAGGFAVPRRFTDEERAGIDAIADVAAVTLDRLLARADERRAQHTVADREGRLRGVFDHMAHFFAMLLPSGEVVDVNAAALAFMRMPRSSVVGRPVWDVPWVVEVGIVERGKADVAKAAAGERVVAEVPFEIPGGGGRMGTFEMTLSPVRDAGGDVRFVIYEARDVTEARDRERQLRELRRRMQLILDATYEGVIGFDGEGRITFANRSAGALLGCAPEALEGEHLRALAQPSDHDAGAPTDSRIAQALDDTDTGRSGADLLRRRDGSPLPVAWHTAAIRGEHGGIEGTVMTFRDVTRELELEAAREQALDEVTRQRLWLGAVIDQAPVGMILVESTAGERIRLNRLARALCGGPMTLEGGVLRAPARVLRADRSPADASWLPLARALRGEAEASEELILGAGDTEVPVLMTATPVADAEGRRVGAVATMHDLRPIKELEREREEWLSVIAHDLRQPLSLILVRLGLLDRSQPPLSEQHRKSVGHMTSSARRVDRLISDLLDVSRIEANRLSLDILSVDTGWFLEDFVERQQPTTGGRPLVLVIDGPLPVIQADPARLEQVLANLVSNAVKYGRADTPIEIRATRTDDDGLLITVSNHGRGIPPAEQQRLFRRFYRIPETRRGGASGVGLGLYICKGLVEAHGGTISIESEPDGITRFHVRLPPRQPPGR